MCRDCAALSFYKTQSIMKMDFDLIRGISLDIEAWSYEQPTNLRGMSYDVKETGDRLSA
jgi:hypothetical protein